MVVPVSRVITHMFGDGGCRAPGLWSVEGGRSRVIIYLVRDWRGRLAREVIVVVRVITHLFGEVVEALDSGGWPFLLVPELLPT